MTDIKSARKTRQLLGHPVANVVALSVVLYAVSAAFLTTGVFFSSDTGLRFLQIRNLLAQDWRTFAIEYPGRFLDPDLEFVPYYYAYLLVKGQIYLAITPFFPLLAAIFYVLLGVWGLPVVPVLGTVATAVGVYQLVKWQTINWSLAKWPTGAIWATGLATPLLFYSAVLWDHSLAAACAIWSLAGLVAASRQPSRRWYWSAFGSGVVAAIGLGQRPEMYVFVVALGVASLLFFYRRRALLWSAAVGGATGVLPLWGWQYVEFGHPLGLTTAGNLFGYGRPDQYPVTPYSGVALPQYTTITRFLGPLVPGDNSAFILFLLLLVGLVLTIAGLRLYRQRWLLAGVVAAIFGYGWVFVRSQTGLLTGLLTTMPLLGLSFALPLGAEPDEPVAGTQFSLVVALLFLGLMLAFWPAYGGLQWGTRYLLPVVGPLVAVAWVHGSWYWRYGRIPRRLVGGTAVSLLLLGVLVQIGGLVALRQEWRDQQRVYEFVSTMAADVVVTNSPFMPSTLSMVDDKLFLYADEPAELATLITRFTEAGIDTFAFVPLDAVTLTVPDFVNSLEIREKAPFIYEIMTDE